MKLDENDTHIPWMYIVICVVATTALVFIYRKFLQSPTHKNGVPIPPGPPATSWFWEDPMPKKHIAQKLTALVERYGPVVSLRSGSRVTIIIGRMDAATETMEKESGALANRPRLVAADIISRGNRILLEPAGERLRRLRRATHTYLQPKAAQMYQEIQTEAAKHVVLDILDSPELHMQHAQRYASTVILRLTYGKTSPTSHDDPEVVRIQRVAANFQPTLKHGAYLVDHLPWLKYLPIYGRQLEEFRRYEVALFRDQLNRAMDGAGPSFGRMLLEHTDDHHLSYDEMAYLAGALFGAGTETTESGVIVMIMAAACHPDAQARVQEELDEVIGRDRVPTFDDWEMLSQLHAFMLEALRWRPVTPLGIPHCAIKDIIWRGQCIPAGATVVGCHWSISRDTVAFPDPEVFDPGRWLTEDGHLGTDKHFYTYGFGRRVCPGQHVANRSLYINLALLLWSFRISQRPGAPIDLGLGSFRDGIVFHPEPFEVDFTPRIEERRLKELMV